MPKGTLCQRLKHSGAHQWPLGAQVLMGRLSPAPGESGLTLPTPGPGIQVTVGQDVLASPVCPREGGHRPS